MFVCSSCHDLLMMSINFDDIATLDINGVNYRYIISKISKNKAVHLFQNTNLSKKKRDIKNYKLFNCI